MVGKANKVKATKVKKKTLSTLMPRWIRVVSKARREILKSDANLEEFKKIFSDDQMIDMSNFQSCMVGESYLRCAGFELNENMVPACKICSKFGMDFYSHMRHLNGSLTNNERLDRIAMLKDDQKIFLNHWNKEHVGQKNIKLLDTSVYPHKVKTIDIKTKKVLHSRPATQEDEDWG